MTVTTAQAETVRAAVVARYASYFQPMVLDTMTLAPLYGPQDGPTVVMDWDGAPAVVWECGPSDWAYSFVMGGSTEEDRALLADASAEFGTSVKAAEPQPTSLRGLALECATSYAVSIYRD